MFSIHKCWRSPAILTLLWLICVPICFAQRPTQEEAQQFVKTLLSIYSPRQGSSLETKFEPEQPKCPECPPCFNCHLPAFECSHFANCSDYDGKCTCLPGFGGEDCSRPVCNSLAEGSKRRLREKDEFCECSEGWEGINCNVCKTDSACDSMMPTKQNGTCYKGGLTVYENFQICDVKNKKILDMLPDQPPQVTFSCHRKKETCDFQFWINQTESFFCHLDECTFDQEITRTQNITQANCDKIKCKCKPGEMLCGKDGSIDLSDWLVEEIKGPAEFKCYNPDDCRFSEPNMNDLILSIFGDKNIFLDCKGGECLHYTEVPGFERPRPPNNIGLIVVSVFAVFTFVAGIFGAVFYLSRNWISPSSSLSLPDDERSHLMANHMPAELLFQDISYNIGDKQVLHSIHGVVKPGEVMAIMGGSGAGKTSFLDILARKNKSGRIRGKILVNGDNVDDETFKNVVGYVDQEDHLLPTLTVYETILYSALLRLPREMSFEAKNFRVMETMSELGILNIKDSRIGDAGARSISGGEKRRVSIACELVTSPSILFLDEPTSGLDAFNAYNVVECLVTLARNYDRTVVCTIHQPRSNIFALFDQLVLLANGYMVYSGEASKCQAYFESIGQKCPPGFNIADYLVDLTMYAVKPHDSSDDRDEYDDSEAIDGISSARPPPITSAERRPILRNRGSSIHDIQDSQLYRPQSRPSDQQENNNGFELNNRDGQNDDSINIDMNGDRMTDHLRMLVDGYNRSMISLSIKDEIDRAETSEQRQPLLASDEENPKISSHLRASWFTQFRILSDRTFKNLYRNPMLMLTHYCISVYLALLCGSLFYKVTNDIAGFQNRMGVLFFMCALFGFGCLTSLHVFASERILFVKERANGYYAPITYFASKVLFDIIPLRVVPPILMGVIIYHMVGLVDGTTEFFKFLLVLVLFNLTAASICLCIGILFKEIGVASLLSSLVMLFSMLFGGLLLNKESIPEYLSWLKDLSFFNYAFEALLVNEVVYLTLVEEKYGLQIDVPGATILSTFGFNASAYWPDVAKLTIMFSSFIVLSFICLQHFVKEKR